MRFTLNKISSLVVCLVLSVGFAPAQDTAAKNPKREPDRMALNREPGPGVSLQNLAWLVGTWKGTTGEREVTITYEWYENQAFLRGSFTLKAGAKTIESGTQIIGKDYAQSLIRAWVFHADGGFSDEFWKQEGRNWSVAVHGVRADGRVLTATNIYVQVDSQTFTWQAVNRTLGGVPILDMPQVMLKKQDSAN